MKNVAGKMTIENGGGNHQPIYDIIYELFDVEQAATTKGYDTALAYAHSLWVSLTNIDCEKFYLPSGAKVTRPLKALLEEQFGKESVKLVFAEFCKRVGAIFITVDAKIMLRSRYFTTDEAGEWGDSGSCFMEGGCNESCGEWLDGNPNTGVITIEPANDTYSRGRIIVWFINPTTAHMVNVYGSHGGKREMPRSVYVRALEVLSNTTISWSQRNDTTLRIYLNRSAMILTAIDGNFDTVCQEYMHKCPNCNKKYRPEQNHFNNEDAYWNACSNNCLDIMTEDEDRINCTECDYRMHRDNAFHAQGDYYCENCYNQRFFYCHCCEEDCEQDGQVEGVSNGHSESICSDCADQHYAECCDCGRYHYNEEIVNDQNDYGYCPKCASKCLEECPQCGTFFSGDDKDNFEDGMCEECFADQNKKKRCA